MPSIPFKHKCLSIILIWVIVSHKLVVVSIKSKKKKFFFFFFFFFTFLNWEKQTWYWGKKVAIFDWEWGRNLAPREGQKMPCITYVSEMKNYILFFLLSRGPI